MKEIKKERTITETYYEYEAIDGEIFKTKEECEKYDKSARAVLQSKYKKLVLKETNEYNLFDIGSEDNTVEIIKVGSQKDLDLVKQMYYMYNSHLDPKNPNEWTKIEFENMDNALKNKDILFIGRGYDDESFWIYGSCNSLCEKINSYRKLTETKPEPEYGGC